MSTSTREIPNRFDFQSAQPRINEFWEKENFAHAEVDASRKPYTIVIPPPNVTGALHLGHALNNTLQDVLIRMKRMQGFNALWMPGTDHAGIATQAVVERRLKEEENKTRHDLGRDKLVERIWQWKDQYETRILSQLKQMGCSCDWQRTRFTLDDQCARAVRHTFFDLFEKDLIYRGKRLVNWDTFLQTAVSDDEVFQETVKGKFWHIRYAVIDPKPGEPEYVIVATTRPETMLGDTAVAVHPNPARALEKSLAEAREKRESANQKERPAAEAAVETLEERIKTHLDGLQQLTDMAADGRMLMLPLMDRPIPLIADDWAKPELGSGCVKITPAHDPNDYMVGQRQSLPMINILNSDGTLNGAAGPFAGLVIKKARKAVVEALEELELLDAVEDRDIELPHSDRSKTPIEPFLADQWFVKMDQLAQSAMDAVSDKRVRISPDRYAKGYHDWLAEKRDWPVSRQLWWGHQIPVWSRACATEDDLADAITEIQQLSDLHPDQLAHQVEALNSSDSANDDDGDLPSAIVHVCVKEGQPDLEHQLLSTGYKREEDVLDTWFSSALWPHSTLGWPEQTPELEYFYPTSTLITSRDIITLWVARMVLMGLNNVGDIPFSRVFIHPKILDGYGETMSKSKGNGIDPLDIIEKFGADALRFSMAHLTTETQDVRMPVQFECPNCEAAIDQTKKIRELPSVECPKCQQPFRTQWAKSEDDLALPRAPVTSERFEVARNFCNKLWNASRFALMHLDGYTPGPVSEAEMTIEDRWILSRLSTVTKRVTEALDAFKYADASRELYGFAWDEFCSFYVEMLKARFADDAQRPVAQRMLAHTLDTLLRLLHPVIPFITEEIWQLLGEAAPERGLDTPEAASPSVMIAAWPEANENHLNQEIEDRYATFQIAIGVLREIRARQNIAPRDSIEFTVKCDPTIADLLRPMEAYFESMVRAKLVTAGPDGEIPASHAVVNRSSMEIYVDMKDFIDEEAEQERLVKEEARIEQAIVGREKKLENKNFVERAPAEVVQQQRDGLEKLRAELKTIKTALETLRANQDKAS